MSTSVLNYNSSSALRDKWRSHSITTKGWKQDHYSLHDHSHWFCVLHIVLLRCWPMDQSGQVNWVLRRFLQFSFFFVWLVHFIRAWLLCIRLTRWMGPYFLFLLTWMPEFLKAMWLLCNVIAQSWNIFKTLQVIIFKSKVTSVIGEVDFVDVDTCLGVDLR